jgi:hypothetical protein
VGLLWRLRTGFTPRKSSSQRTFSIAAEWEGVLERLLTKRPGVKTQRFVLYMGLSLLAGILLVSLFLALSSSGAAGAGQQLGIGVAAAAISCAAGALGAAAGFLFGLPRARFAENPAGGGSSGPGVQPRADQGSGDRASEDSASAETQLQDGQVLAAARVNSVPSTRYLTNSNLIKVSDWLTTIIIGLGLVNLAKLIPGIRKLGNTLEAPLGGTPYSATIGVSLVIGVGLSSFLLTYLWTSIRVRELLEDAERQTEKDVVPQLEGSSVRRAIEDVAATSLQLRAAGKISEDAIVETQNPAAGTLVARGSPVTIAVQ